MHYDDIFLFVQLIEKGSFSSLSRHTGITQSTISRRVQNLEEYLGQKLLKRNTRGLFELSDAGVVFYSKFKNLATEITSYVDEFKTPNDYSGVLRIAIPRVLFSALLVPVIHQFQEQYPNIQLIFTYSGSDVDLLLDNLDMAIVIKLPKNQNYKQRLLITSNNYLYANQKYIDKYGAPLELTALDSHNIVGESFNNQVYDKLVALDSQTGEYTEVKYLPKIITNNALFNLDFALNDGYIVNATEFLVQKEVLAGNLVKLLPTYSFGETKFYLILHNGLRNKLETVFVEFVIKILENNIG